MAKKKRPTDINLLARQIVEEAIGEPLTETTPTEQKPTKEKNPAAVALGRLGGLKGGKARADRLSPEERQSIARKAARKRWDKKE